MSDIDFRACRNCGKSPMEHACTSTLRSYEPVVGGDPEAIAYASECVIALPRGREVFMVAGTTYAEAARTITFLTGLQAWTDGESIFVQL